jgi:hypothetical protein
MFTEGDMLIVVETGLYLLGDSPHTHRYDVCSSL